MHNRHACTNQMLNKIHKELYSQRMRNQSTTKERNQSQRSKAHTFLHFRDKQSLSATCGDPSSSPTKRLGSASARQQAFRQAPQAPNPDVARVPRPANDRINPSPGSLGQVCRFSGIHVEFRIWPIKINNQHRSSLDLHMSTESMIFGIVYLAAFGLFILRD